MIKLETKNIYFIQVYFPIPSSSPRSDEEIEIMYEQIEKLLQLTEDNSIFLSLVTSTLQWVVKTAALQGSLV